MEITKDMQILWHKIELDLDVIIPSHIKNAFS